MGVNFTMVVCWRPWLLPFRLVSQSLFERRGAPPEAGRPTALGYSEHHLLAKGTVSVIVHWWIGNTDV